MQKAGEASRVLDDAALARALRTRLSGKIRKIWCIFIRQRIHECRLVRIELAKGINKRAAKEAVRDDSSGI